MDIRVLIADDNALFREGLSSLLGRDPSVTVVGQAKNAAEAVRKAIVMRPDIVLMDLEMPLGGGIEATRQILQERPDQVICIVTVSEHHRDLYEAIRCGARGYLLKTMMADEFCRSLRVLAEGGAVVAPRLAAQLLDEFSRLLEAAREQPPEIDALTEREREVLDLVAQGASNKEIAAHLHIKVNTVKVHLRNILEKLNLRNRQHAAAFAVQEGFVTELREHMAGAVA